MHDTMTWTTKDDGTQTASPSSEFWDVWRADKAAVKSAGYSVSKPDGTWTVTFRDPKPVIQESRALSSDIEVPAPYGLEYFGYQKAGIKFIHDKDALLADDMGTGKGQAHGSKVYTPSGPVNIEDIRVGDYVIGSSGKPVKVTGVFPLGYRDIYRVKFTDESHLDVTEDHLWQVRNLRTTKVLTVSQLMDKNGEVLSVGTGINDMRTYSSSTFYKESSGNNRWMIPLVSPVEFSERAVLIEPYTMGLYLGDGSFTERGYVHVSSHVDDVHELYGARQVSLRPGTSVVSFYDIDHVEYIKSSGLITTRSWNKFIPEEYKYNSVKVRLSLLQGLMDSDGYAGKHHTEFSTCSKRLCDDLVEIVQSLGGTARVRSRVPTYSYGGEKHSGRLNYRVNVKLPCGMIPFRLKRKVDSYSPPSNYTPSRRICSIEKLVLQQQATCISVDAADSLYVAEQFIVTHNTIQTAGAINLHPEYERILVICPNSLKLNWKRELTKWLVNPYTIGVVSRADYPDTDIVIMNYDVADKHKEKLHEIEWDLLVLDEAHYLKNENTLRTKAILGKGKKVPGIKAKHKIFLTGTPIMNRPIEMFPLLNALDPKAWSSKWNYAMRYCDGKNTGWGWDFSGASNLEELNHKLRSSIMIRRTKAEALPELPGVFHQVIELPATAETRKLTREEDKVWEGKQDILDELKAAVEIAKVSENEDDYKEAVKNLRSGMSASFSEMARIRKEIALAKVPYVVEHLNDIEGKVVVFFHHREVGFKLKEALGDNAVMVMGGDSVEDRQDAVDSFQTNPATKYFLGSITAAGVGLTLTASSHVVFTELDYRPSMMNQAYSRCQRIGQQNNVLVQYLLIEDSLDVKIAHSLIEKQEIIDKALDELVEDVPMPDTSSVKLPPRSKMKVEPVSDEEKADLLSKLRYLAFLDYDRALTLNDMGFNRVDSRIGHSLASMTKLTDRQAALARVLVNKYRRQLSLES